MLEALEAANYSTPTPIQQQAIPIALEGRDIIGCAATGTGKTAAFLLPILDRLAGKRGVRALVLAPTRELVMQIVEHAERFGEPHGLRVATIIGGASMRVQVAELRQQRELIVATPGRLVDHLQEGTARLDGIEVLVLDEADRMLDMGFRPQLERILKYVPKQRQTLLFSATIDGEVGAFAKRCLVDPAKVEIEKAGTLAKGATQTAYVVDESEKPALLLSLISKLDEPTLVFTRTQHRADKVAKMLARVGVAAGRIHGGRTQGQRLSALEGFKDRRIRVLVATDIAARGIDVAGIGHVVIYDLSRTAEDHVHRVGRTARNEAIGHASTFVTHQEAKGLRDVEKYTGTRIVRGEIPADLAERRAEIESAKHAPAPARTRSNERPERPERFDRKSRGSEGRSRFDRRDERPRRFDKPKQRGFEVMPKERDVERDEDRRNDEESPRESSPAPMIESPQKVEKLEKPSRRSEPRPEERPDRDERRGTFPPRFEAAADRDDDESEKKRGFERKHDRAPRGDAPSTARPSTHRPVREWSSKPEQDRRESTRSKFESKRGFEKRGGFGKPRAYGDRDSRGGFGKPRAHGDRDSRGGFGKPRAHGDRDSRGGFGDKRRFEERPRFDKERATDDKPTADRDSRGGARAKFGARRFDRSGKPGGFSGHGAKKPRFGDRSDSRDKDRPREGGKPGFASKSRFRPKNRFRGERS